jgi:hypothetical protein
MRSGARIGSIAAAIAVLSSGLGGCGRDRALEPATAGRRVEGEGAAARMPSGRTAGLDEADARFLLAARFRAAGFRIVADVPLGEGDVTLTIDGFDPERRVGYEYVAAKERGVELDEAERGRLARLAGATVLVVDPADAAAVSVLADRFLAGVARASARDAGSGH